MAFLPIVERELRVAARRKTTHRLRVWTSVAALFVCLFMLPRGLLFGSYSNLGPHFYSVLTYYAFVLSLLGGVFLTADCISSEKREGTLGLLFLTDLKGRDVVFGKLAASGLNALCGLVAALPVTGLPLLMGGVTGAEFWRVSLALVNTLFVALSVGLLVSTCSRDASNAVSMTFAVLFIGVVGLPFVGIIMAGTPIPVNAWYLVSVSPYYPFRYGAAARYISWPERYWISLAASHLFAWLMLIVACWILPRAWQDKPRRRVSWIKKPLENLVVPKKPQSFARRERLLNANPVTWLIHRDGGADWLFRVFALIFVMAIALVLLVDHSFLGMTFASSATWIFGLILKVRIAFMACEFFVNARRSGAMEMLLGTPLTNKQIISGQWAALRRSFLWPVCVVIVGQLVVLYWMQGSNVVPGLGSAGSQFLVMSGGRGNFFGIPFNVLQAVAGPLRVSRYVADVLALGWMGMWLGLTAKKPGLAPFWNILLVMILPNILFCVPFVGLICDLVLILWARENMVHRLRAAALPQYYPAYFARQGEMMRK